MSVKLLDDISSQKAIIYKLCNYEILSSCRKVIKADYFDKSLKEQIEAILNAFDSHDCSLTKSEMTKYDLDVNIAEDFISTKQSKYEIDEVYKFCQYSAAVAALTDSLQLLNTGNYSAIIGMFNDIVNMKSDMTVGLDYFNLEQFDKRIDYLRENVSIPTCLRCLDKHIKGLNRRELLLILAASAGGKSLFMVNIGCSYVARGYNVLIITLELSEEIYATRADAIITESKMHDLLNNTEKVKEKIKHAADSGYGTLNIKRLPERATCANDIKNQIELFERTFKKQVDVLIIDYIDLMKPNNADSDNLFIREKYIAEEVRALLNEYDLIGISACQFNRSVHQAKAEDVGHDKISGGMSKINTADNVIGIYRDAEDKANNMYQILPMKFRNHAMPDEELRVSLNANNLRLKTDGDSFDIVAYSRMMYKKALEDKDALDESKNIYEAEYKVVEDTSSLSESMLLIDNMTVTDPLKELADISMTRENLKDDELIELAPFESIDLNYYISAFLLNKDSTPKCSLANIIKASYSICDMLKVSIDCKSIVDQLIKDDWQFKECVLSGDVDEELFSGLMDFALTAVLKDAIIVSADAVIKETMEVMNKENISDRLKKFCEVENMTVSDEEIDMLFESEVKNPDSVTEVEYNRILNLVKMLNTETEYEADIPEDVNDRDVPITEVEETIVDSLSLLENVKSEQVTTSSVMQRMKERASNNSSHSR